MKTIYEYIVEVENATLHLDRALQRKFTLCLHADVLERVLKEVRTRGVNPSVAQPLRNPERLFDGNLGKLLDLFKKVLTSPQGDKGQ